MSDSVSSLMSVILCSVKKECSHQVYANTVFIIKSFVLPIGLKQKELIYCDGMHRTLEKDCKE